MASNEKKGNSLEVAKAAAVGEEDVVPRTRFTEIDLFHEQSLDELVSQGVKFKIIAYHKHNLTLFDVMPFGDYEDEMFRLKEEICNYVKEGGTKFQQMPEIGDVVIAKKENEYRRGFIMDFVGKKEVANVYWVDVGGMDKIKVSELIPVTEEIMKCPRLSYAVILEDMFPTSNFILWSGYESLMESMRCKEFSMTLGRENPIHAYFFSKKLVTLSYKESTVNEVQVIDIHDEIKQLRKWEWEIYSNLTGTDDEICEKGWFGKWYRTAFPKDRFPYPYVLAANSDEFSATVARLMPDATDPAIANLVVYLLIDGSSTYLNYFNVLHYQLKRYAENIKATKFYPALGEPLMLRIADKPKYRKIFKMVGIWVRAIRATKERLYLFDWDEYVPFSNEEISKDCEMRPFYYEFFKIPQLCINARPIDKNGKPLTMKEAAEKIQVGKRYHFVVKKDLGGDKTDSLYEVTFGPARKTEEDYGAPNFLRNHRN